LTPDVLVAILERALRHPDHPAVKDLARDLDYAGLRQAAARMANALAARGVSEGDRVALLLPNSVDFVVAALATLWVGALFVPLAVTDPAARVVSIVADCAAALVVTADSPDDGVTPASALAPTPAATVAQLTVDAGERADPVPAPDRTAYAIYTSGTTGTPKGVLIGNAAFSAAVTAAVDALGIDVSTRTLCVSPFHFDGSFGTLFPTLYAGGSVVIRPRDTLLFPRTFFNAVANEDITYTGFSPSYLRVLLSSPQVGKLGGTTLSVVALGGEACSVADVEALWAAAPQVRVFNRYGPTETTIAVTHVELTPEMVARGVVPIGRPHDDVTFHVVDGEGRLVEGSGQVGELHIGGSQLMTGYWGAPALTDEVLRTDVLAGRTVYRTGDLVYRTDEGDYVYVDRADRVIKRMGVRISLVELAEALRRLEGVTAAVCVAYDGGGQLAIAAFVTGEGLGSPLDIRRAAAGLLPDSMLPDRIEPVPNLPLTRSSKVDERRLVAEAGLTPLAAGGSDGRAYM
jgi:D-alanine--poly(phosphoribitol) ligase subunit 1